MENPGRKPAWEDDKKLVEERKSIMRLFTIRSKRRATNGVMQMMR